MKKFILGIFQLLLLFNVGCEKEIDFNYIDIEPLLVIEGALTQDGATVSLTLTTPMDEPMDKKCLTDAKVSITDITTGQIYPLTPDDDGIYLSNITGEENHTYLLEVERDGVAYKSESTMGAVSTITDMEFSWIKMPYDEVAVLQLSFTDNPNSRDDCYWVRLYRNGEAYQWAEVRDAGDEGGYVNKVFMTTRRDIDEEDEDDLLLDGDVVTATLVPISREMFSYLEALSVGNSNGPRMFEGGFCLGYFLAGPISRREIVFHR